LSRPKTWLKLSLREKLFGICKQKFNHKRLGFAETWMRYFIFWKKTASVYSLYRTTSF